MGRKNKKDLVEEILDKRSRLVADQGRWGQLLPRLLILNQMAQLAQRLDGESAFARPEIAKYLAISYVAGIEGFCRLAYRDLIDQNTIFRGNVPKLDLKFTLGLDHIVAIECGKMTLGEFIAHLLPLSSLEDINNAMSTLIGEDFLAKFKRTPLRLSNAEKSLEELGIESDVLKSVKNLFAWRHIFAHELTTYEVDVDAVVECAKWGSIFLAVMSRFVTGLLGEKPKSIDVSQVVYVGSVLGTCNAGNSPPNPGPQADD
jgi:hypothetical protein